MNDTMIIIEQLLRQEFTPTLIELVDESHFHAGHAGAQPGKGHYAVTIHSEAFSGKNSIQRHRMIFDTLGNMMQTNIHALRITAKTPQ